MLWKCFILAPLALQVAAAGQEAPIPGYDVHDLSWNVEVFPGREPLVLTGTIQQVHQEAKRLNPGFEPTTNDTRNLASREAPWKWVDLICGPGPNQWQYATKKWVQEGIKYLRRVKSKPHIGPGPEKCSRVSCGDDASIWLCNDNEKDHLWLESFGEVADGAQKIVDYCSVTSEKYSPLTVGQIFTDRKWNVIVREDESSWC